DGKVHDFDYLLRPVDGHWRVINVVADGVSDLSVKRAEFAHVMKTKGFTGLIQRLNRHIVRMAHGQ
ncbi:MAG: ABC transporter substrate-binding protein, partial [Acidiferrobacteraceae bacterium]